MTLYWWNHWFWITIISVLATLPFTSVATYPINSPSLEKIEELKNNNNKNSKLPLEFPLPAQTDVDDIFTGSENIPRTFLLKEKIIEKLNSDKEEILSISGDQDKAKLGKQINEESTKDIEQSIENPKKIHKIDKKGNVGSNDNNSSIIIESNINNNSKNNNSYSDPNSSKSVIKIIPKAINQNNHKNDRELDSVNSESGISAASIFENMRNTTESLDVVSFDNNSNKNNINKSNVSNVSTNISIGEKSHEELKLTTTSSPLFSATTGEYQKGVSHIMQVTKSSSKIKSKTSISSISNNNENASLITTGLDETTTGNDAISMTTILHPVDGSYGSINEDSNLDTVKSENKSDNEMTARIPVTLENVTKLSDKTLSKESERVRKSKGLTSEYRDAFINNYSTDAKSLLTRSAGQEDYSDKNRIDDTGGNVSSEALQVRRAYVMDAGTISGICLSVLAICCGVGTIGIVLYRRRFLNKPQALSEPDSSVYIDDSTIRDNSDEMYSLDNDSFLNSLEAMTIQNYWTDTVKHTKL